MPDRAHIAHLFALPEHVIGKQRIEEFFSEHFIAGNFWTMWRTAFAFQNWHSAIELSFFHCRKRGGQGTFGPGAHARRARQWNA